MSGEQGLETINSLYRNIAHEVRLSLIEPIDGPSFACSRSEVSAASFSRKCFRAEERQ